MYKKILGETIRRTIDKYFNEVSYKIKLEVSDKMIDFICRTIDDNNDFHTYKGYVGGVGQIVIQRIDDNKLEEYITIN